MTLDERLNNLEDQIKKIEDTIKHNNQTARKVNESFVTQLKSLNTAVEALKVKNVGDTINMGDTFFGGFPGSKK